MSTTVLWFRRDLRLADNPALVEAQRNGDDVVALFVVDDRLWGPAGDSRRAFLAGSLRALDDSLGGSLVVRGGDPAVVVADVAREVEAPSVFVADDFGPYGRERDEAVARALERDRRVLAAIGSPYAVAPGSVVKADGEPFKVFTPFRRAWSHHGWGAPVAAPRDAAWATGMAGRAFPTAPATAAALPEPGEAAAKRVARRFWERHLDGYRAGRDRPDLDATSRLSPYLKWGAIHPRQLLAKLGTSAADDAFRTELCWREFYADVLLHRPDTARRSFTPRMAQMRVDTGPLADERFDAWRAGRTGYPIVDAGMRQLAGEAWVHNRVRMIVASFLVKDLHVDWTRGARHFMAALVDGDLASNQHGWQWTAGTGTDAAPYFRIFNPVTQGKRFDPDGAYVRRWVPELRAVAGAAVHEPWKLPSPPPGYPAPIVDHATERLDALARLGELDRS